MATSTTELTLYYYSTQLASHLLRSAQQREWLDSYHTWLRNLPVNEKINGQGGPSEEGAPLTLYDRLCMMETSVLLQSQELKRTKRLFLRDKDRLERQISEGLESIEERDILLVDKERGGRKLEDEKEKLEEKNENLRFEIDDLKVLVGKLKLEAMRGAATGASTRGSVDFAPTNGGGGGGGRSSLTSSRKYSSGGGSPTKNDFNFNAEINGTTGAAARRWTSSSASGGGGGGRTSNAGSTPGVGGRKSSSSSSKIWTKHFDTTHGVDYFFNTLTQETTWEEPEGFASEK